MSLKRLHQLFIVEEATEATANSGLFSAANGSYLVIDPTLVYDSPRFEREINRSSLTPLQGLSGMQNGMLKFGLELTGTSAFGTVPQFGLPLRACGFRQEILIKLTIGTITSGPFRHGELVTQLTSGATGTVVADTYTGQTTLWVTKGTNASLGNAIAFTTTGGHTLSAPSGAGCPAPSATNTSGGYGWWPQSYALQSITFDATGLADAISDGDLLKGTTSGALANAYGAFTTGANKVVYVRRVSGHFTTGETMQNVMTSDTNIGVLAAASFETQFQIPSLTMGLAKDGVRESIQFSRGTVALSGTIGEPLKLDFEFKGGKYAIADQGNINSGITWAQSVPPVMLDADLGLGRASAPGLTYALEVVPCIRSITLAMNNDVNFVECAAEATGINNTHITGRKPTGSVDPDLMAEAYFPWMTDFLANTSFRARFTIGSAAMNQFLFTMPALSTVSAEAGDRNGISTRQINFEMTGGSQTVSSTSVENELVIIAPYA